MGLGQIDLRAYETLLCCLIWIFSPEQIAPLNGLRNRVATIDKTQTGTRMHELLVALDLEHRVSTIGAPTLSFRRLENHFLEYLQH
jgi:hypothetical protein